MGLFDDRLRAYLTVFRPVGQIDGAVYDEQHGGWKYPPDAYIPEISFAIGDHYFVLNAVDFGFASAGDGYTLGGIQSRGDMDYDICGDIFLKSLYVVCECQRRPSRSRHGGSLTVARSQPRGADSRRGSEGRLSVPLVCSVNHKRRIC